MAKSLRVVQRLLVGALTCFIVVPATRADELPRGDAKTAGFAPDKLELVPALLKSAIEKKQIAGASTLIARNGKIVQLASVGMQDIESKTPISEKTIYRIASMSKPITSVAIMILAEGGKLKVTDPLSKFVPEFKEMKVAIVGKDGKSFETVKAEREITIHDLLTHTSGITYRIMNKPVVGDLYAKADVSDGLAPPSGTLADNVRKIAKLPLVCQPGSTWEYGLSTDVLGHIVEVVSGKSLEEFMSERLFKPLKMNDTTFVLPQEKHGRLATLYSVGMDKKLTRIGEGTTTMGPFVFAADLQKKLDNKYFSGGAGLASTIGDYFRFCQMLLNKGELHGARVLKPETVAEMTKNQVGDIRIMFPGNDLMGYGFGILSEKGKETSNDPAGVGTYAWGGAFGTYFWIDPKHELTAVLMTQAFPPDFALGTEFKKLAYEALK